jgi:hypothetical protein
MLESGAAEKQLDGLRRELVFMACAYVDACTARALVGEENTGLTGTFFFRSSARR